VERTGKSSPPFTTTLGIGLRAVPGTAQLEKGLIRTYELLEALQKDIDTAYATLEKNRESQYLRRCLVRAVFSYIEALVECIKVELRSTVRTRLYRGELTKKDHETLGPLHVIGAKTGKFLPLEQNVKRTFRLAAKIWDLRTFRLRTEGQDFQDFLAAKSARNRLTHPRTFYDIEVTDQDMHCHTIAGMWAQAEFKRLFKARVRGLADQLSENDRAALLKELHVHGEADA
jgi:hypothetical protein